jgi:hypothetical protein
MSDPRMSGWSAGWKARQAELERAMDAARTNPYRFSGYASKARAWQEGYDAAVAALRVPANGPGADRG